MTTESFTLLESPSRVQELDRLGDEIAELSAHLDAATARLLDLIREFDARGGWNTGFRSCAEWLSWRGGLAPGAARERGGGARARGGPAPARRGARARAGRAGAGGAASVGRGARPRTAVLCQGACVDSCRYAGDGGASSGGWSSRHGGTCGGDRSLLATGRTTGP